MTKNQIQRELTTGDGIKHERMERQEIAEVDAQIRDSSLGPAKFLRARGKIPAVIYGRGRNPINLVLSMKEFVRKYRSRSLASHLIKVNIDGRGEYALLREVQRHVVKGTIEHIDFQFVDTKKEVKVDVPIHFINENKCLGIKLGGTLNILHRTITVRCYPQDIPEFIEVDLSGKTIGQSIHVDEVKLPKNIKLALKEDDTIILVISSASFTEGDNTDTDKIEVAQQL